MCMTCLQKSRYGTCRVRHLHVRLLGAPQLCQMHDIQLDQLLLYDISQRVFQGEASPACVVPWCKSADTAHEAFITYIHPLRCTIVGGESRHM